MPDINKRTTVDEIKNISNEEEKETNSGANINDSKSIEMKEPNVFQKAFRRVKKFFKEVGETIRRLSAVAFNRAVLGNENYRKQVNRDYIEARKSGMEGMFKVPEKDELLDKIIEAHPDDDIDIKKLGEEIEEAFNSPSFREITTKNNREFLKMFNESVDDIINNKELNAITITRGKTRSISLYRHDKDMFSIKQINGKNVSENLCIDKEKLEECKKAVNEQVQKKMQEQAQKKEQSFTTENVGSFIENEGVTNTAIAEYQAEITTINCFNKEAYDKHIEECVKSGTDADIRVIDTNFRAEIREGSTQFYTNDVAVKKQNINDKHGNDERKFNKYLGGIINDYHRGERTSPATFSYSNKDITIIPTDTSMVVSVMIEDKVYKETFVVGEKSDMTSFIKDPQKYKDLSKAENLTADTQKSFFAKETLNEILDDVSEKTSDNPNNAQPDCNIEQDEQRYDNR